MDGTTGCLRQAPQTGTSDSGASGTVVSHGESEESATQHHEVRLGQEPSDGQITRLCTDEAVATSDSPAPDSTGGLRPRVRVEMQDLWTLGARCTTPMRSRAGSARDSGRHLQSNWTAFAPVRPERSSVDSNRCPQSWRAAQGSTRLPFGGSRLPRSRRLSLPTLEICRLTDQAIQCMEQ